MNFEDICSATVVIGSRSFLVAFLQ